MNDEVLLLTAPAVLAAVLVVFGLRSWSASPVYLMLAAVVAAALGALLSFLSGFSIAWTIEDANLAVVLAAIASGFVAAAIVFGTARLVGTK